MGRGHASLFRAPRNAAATADLKDHACLVYSHLAAGETWRFTDARGEVESVTAQEPLSATNAEALSFALEAGVGIALQPDFLAWEAVRDGRLVAVLGGWAAPLLRLNLVTPAKGPHATRIAVLLDFLTRRFTTGAAPWTLASGPSR